MSIKSLPNSYMLYSKSPGIWALGISGTVHNPAQFVSVLSLQFRIEYLDLEDQDPNLIAI